VDDEHSLSLFSGYAVAALRLSAQFAAQGIAVDEEHPLFVYIPCGVGGAPGGVCYGLKHVFGAAVHCFFVEPEDSACFLVQMQNPDKPGISIYDAGQHNRTIADGLAVPRASELVYPLMRERLAGVVITSDECMHADVWRMQSLARFKVEPSAAAAVSGPRALLQSEAGRRYIAEQGLQARMLRANHIVWTTGGALMPGDEYEALLLEGERASDGLFGALADTGGN
jgi:D-serine dehydratase